MAMKSKRIKNAVKIDIPINKLGYSGAIGEIFFLEDFKGNVQTDDERLNDKSDRNFFIKCILNKNNTITNGMNFDSDKNDGDSYFLVSPNMAYARIEIFNGLIKLYKNSKNEISMLTSTIASNSKENALSQFTNIITPFLDHLSFIGNVPINIQYIIGRDEKNRITFATFPNPYQTIPIEFSQELIPNEMIPIFSLYREAKNNQSQYYKFLCYYKILEGVYLIRKSSIKNVKKKNIPFKFQKEIVPNHKALRENHNDFISRSINDLFKNYFRKEFRIAIAHFTKKEKDPFNISDYKTIRTIADNVILIELCCRVVINSQMGFFKQTSNSS